MRVLQTGFYPAVNTSDNNTATGPTWIVCLSDQIASNATCNGGVGAAPTRTDHVIPKRIYYAAGVSGA